MKWDADDMRRAIRLLTGRERAADAELARLLGIGRGRLHQAVSRGAAVETVAGWMHDAERDGRRVLVVVDRGEARLHTVRGCATVSEMLGSYLVEERELTAGIRVRRMPAPAVRARHALLDTRGQHHAYVQRTAAALSGLKAEHLRQLAAHLQVPASAAALHRLGQTWYFEDHHRRQWVDGWAAAEGRAARWYADVLDRACLSGPQRLVRARTQEVISCGEAAVVATARELRRRSDEPVTGGWAGDTRAEAIDALEGAIRRRLRQLGVARAM